MGLSSGHSVSFQHWIDLEGVELVGSVIRTEEELVEDVETLGVVLDELVVAVIVLVKVVVVVFRPSELQYPHGGLKHMPLDKSSQIGLSTGHSELL